MHSDLVKKRVRVGAAVFWTFLALGWIPGRRLLAQAPSREPTEYQLKAAYLYNFAKFVEWPPEAFTEDGDKFILGVLGDDPFGPQIEETLSGRLVADRPIVLKRFSSLDDVDRCHLLFISSSEQARLGLIFNTLRRLPVLTVGETSRFLQQGGMIRFQMERRRVRFHINVRAAERAGLKISSQLLQVARSLVGAQALPAE